MTCRLYDRETQMKILILPPSDYLGHPNPCRLHHVFERFPAFGDEIYVMRFSLYDKIARKSNAKVFSINDVKSKSLPIYYGINSGIFAKSATSIINKFDINVILFANLYPPYIVSKIVRHDLLSVVDLVDHYPTVAAENVPRIIPKAFVTSLFTSMMRSVIRNSDTTVACSYQLADYAKQSGARDVHRIPNGVEEYFFKDYRKEAVELRHKFGISDSDLLVCFVGNIEYWLGMGELIQGLYLFRKKAKKNIKFLLVGGKLATNYISEIEKQVKALNLEENVVQVGFVPHNEVPKYIAASDICVNPKNPKDPVSYYSSPVKVWEYLSQEKPVISTPIPEVLYSASECVSIANTPEQYCSCLMAFSEDPSYFLERAKKGRELAKEYNWTRIAKTYRSLLLDLLNRKENARA
jgi:glycosyltransferase involved in cell wall biosynthesis